jgi:hypothetical protein
MGTNRLGKSAAAGVVALILILPTPAPAQVTVVRHESENPVKSIATSTLYGALAGLTLGVAIGLVAEENEDDIIKWCFVGGTFFGFGYGIYHVSTRPQPSSFLATTRPGERLGIPRPILLPSRLGPKAVGLRLISVTF